MELLFCFFIFVSCVRSQGQTLLSALQGFSELSTFTQYANSSSTLTRLISSANNVTLFAPSNDAFGAWLPEQAPGLPKDQIEAILTYHFVNGVFPSKQFSNQPQFPSTFLSNTSYTNVTGGQRVELVSSDSGRPEIISYNQSVSSITTQDSFFTGGLIQIIDKVLTIPDDTVGLITGGAFGFFVDLLTTGGYFDPYFSDIVANAIYDPNTTIFAPNTKAGADDFNTVSAGMSQEKLGELFNYHVVPNFIAYSTELKNGMQLPTSQGTNVTITVQGNNTFVNGAKIIAYNYLVANGVVLMIDDVLNPANTTGPPSVPSPTSTNPPSTASQSKVPSSAPTSGLSLGAKVGMGVGIPLGLCALAGGIYFLLRRREGRTVDGTPNGTPKGVWNFLPWDRSKKKTQRDGDIPGHELDANQKHELDANREHELDAYQRYHRQELDAQQKRNTTWGGELDGIGTVQTNGSLHY